MGYSDFLKKLLAPTGIYELESGVGGAELLVIGKQLDRVFEELEKFGEEMTLSTAHDYGLNKFAQILPYRPTGTDVEDVRRAIMALLRIRRGCFTLRGLQDTVSGCGVSATVEETEEQNVIVTFPGVRGIPHDFQTAKKQIEEILPCHISAKYVFEYALWSALLAAFRIWGDFSGVNLTWDHIEKYQ